MTNDDNLNRPRFLEGKEVFLTPALIEDAEQMYLWTNDRDALFLGGPSIRPRTLAEQQKALEGQLTQKSFQIYSIILKKTGEHVGYAVVMDIDEMNRMCEWGLQIGPEYWNKGYATEVGRLILGYLFKDLGLQKVKSETHSGNPGSIRLQKRLGMVHEGTMRRELYIRGEYYDSVRHGMLREEYFEKYGD